MKDKNVLVILLEPIDSDGRVQRQVKALSKIANVHCICCVDEKLPNDKYFTSIGKHRKSKLGMIWLNIKAAWVFFLKFKHYDTVWVNNIESSIFGLFIRRFFSKTNIIYDSHELVIPDPTSGASSFSKISRFLEKMIVNSCNKVIAANYERAILMEKYYNLESTPLVIPNYLENCYGSDDSPFECRKDLVYQGVINANRYLESIIRSFEHVRNGRFHLIGDGPSKSHLESIVTSLGLSSRVVFHPKLPREKLYEFTRKFRFGLVSYDFSSLNNKLCAPNKVSEYVLNGMPIITTPQESLVSIIDEYNVGFYLSKEHLLNSNYISIARTIDSFFLSENISSESINDVKSIFDFDNYLHVFEEALSG